MTTTPFVTNELSGDVGLDVLKYGVTKYGVTQNLTADLTINTDFAQVEADEQRVNLTRFSLFFPEKREFFLENQGLFGFGGGARGPGGAGDTPVVFYSRRIGLNEGREVPIIAGGRLTGRAGKFEIGFLNMQTGAEPRSGAVSTNFTVGRVKRDVLRRSNVGAIFTNRSVSTFGDGSNQVLGFDGNFAFYDNLSIIGYWTRTRTPGVTGRDTSYRGSLDYNGDRYGVRAEHLLIDERFSPEVGFVRRPDLRKSSGGFRFSPRPRSIESVRKFSGEVGYDYITNAAGVIETREAVAQFGIELQNSDEFRLSLSDTDDVLDQPFEIAPGVIIPVGRYDYWNTRASFSLGQQRRASGQLFVEHGTFFDGERTGVGFAQGRVELTPRFSFEPGVSMNWVDLPQGSFMTELVTTRTTYTVSPLMFVSALIQYNSTHASFGTNVRLRWEYQPGSELFVVYSDDHDTNPFAPDRSTELRSRSFVVKVNRLFRF